MARIRSLILLKSVHHLNTAKVARSIAEVLQADVVAPEDVTPEIINEYDLFGFGSGVYFCRLHSALRHWVTQLKPSIERHQAFVFSTAGSPYLQRLWHRPVKKALSKSGFDVIGEYCCRGYDTVGPLSLVGGLNRGHPDEKDLALAVTFAQKLIVSFQNHRSVAGEHG